MKKIPIWKNVILLVSSFVIVIVATFAWFYTGHKADTNNLSTQVSEAYYIQISDDNGKNWSDDLNVENGINNSFKEISGNGIDFFIPMYDNVGNPDVGYSTQIVSFEKLNDNQYYYEQIFDFRGNMVKDIYLKPESYVTALDNGYIDGAIRVAFIELSDDGKETLKYIWAPNSAIEYSPETQSFVRDGKVEPYYFYQKSLIFADLYDSEESNDDIARISTENTDENGCGYNQEYNFMWSNGQNLPSEAPPVLTVDDLGEDSRVYKKLKVRVWLEGYDRECVSLLNGQKFTMNLQFTAQKGE